MAEELGGFLSHHKSGNFRDLDLPETARDAPEDHLLIWVLDGGIAGARGGERLTASMGDLVLFPPGVPQRYAPTGRPWQWLWVHYGGRAAPAAYRLLLRGGSGPVAPLGYDAGIRQRFRELVVAAAQGARTANQLHLDSCLHSVIGLIAGRQALREELAEHPPAGPRLTAADFERVAELREWIIDHVDEPLTLDRLTAHTGYSASSLARLFRRAGAPPPMAYVTQVRMQQARALLDETELNVREIGRAVGFDDPYHFSRRFRASAGAAPTAYRNRIAASGGPESRAAGSVAAPPRPPVARPHT
ncbi:MAG: AraC family transcriptional regulator [Mycobacteriales bacterium]